MGSTVTFVLFVGAQLLAVVGVLIYAYILGTFITKSIARTNRISPLPILMTTLIFVAVSVGLNALPLYIITSKPYLQVFLIIAAFSICLTVIAELAWNMFGNINVPHLEKAMWYLIEYRKKNAKSYALLSLLPTLAFIGYCIWIARPYFAGTLQGINWDAFVLQSTFVLIAINSVLMLILGPIPTLANKNVDRSTRDRLFLNGVALAVTALVPLTLVVGLTSAEVTTRKILDTRFAITPELLLMSLLGLFLLLVCPYIIGRNRHGRWLTELSTTGHAIKSKLLDGLNSTSEVTQAAAIETAQNDLLAALEEIKRDPGVHALNTVMNDKNPAEMVNQFVGHTAWKSDPRQKHEAKLIAVGQHLEDFINGYDEGHETAVKAGRMKQVKAAVSGVSMDISDTDKGGTAKSFVTIAIAFVALAMSNPFLTAFKDYLALAIRASE